MSRFRLHKLSAIPLRFPSITPRLTDLPFSPIRNFSAALSRGMESADTENDASFKYTPLEDVEQLERYRPGGYHPIVIGDRLHDRYRIVHKLGFGAYSTIWLARDEEAARYVAIKISVADGSPQESNILRQLGSVYPKDRLPKNANIPSLLDEFVIKGPNGEHRCFVTPPARMSLSEGREASYTRLFQLPVARAIAAQLIQVVAFLHSQGVVHAGVSAKSLYIIILWSMLTNLPEFRYSPWQYPSTPP